MPDLQQQQPPQQSQDGTPYFPSYTFEEGNSIKKYSPIFTKIRYNLMQIWPYVNSLLNFLFYETLKVVRGVAKIAISQIRMK